MTILPSNPRRRYHLMCAIVFLLPNFVGFIAFTAWPVLLSLGMSFTDWSTKLYVEPQFIGFRNYIDILTDSQFWFYLYNTVYFMMGIPFSVVTSLVLASLLVDSMNMRHRSQQVSVAVMAFFIAAGVAFLLLNRGRGLMGLTVVLGSAMIVGVGVILLLMLARGGVRRAHSSGKMQRLLLSGTILCVGMLNCALLFGSGNRDAALLLGVLFIAGGAGVLWGSMTYRTMLYVPSFAAGVATIILWKQVFNPYHGLANSSIDYFLDVTYLADLLEYLTGQVKLVLPTWLSSKENLLGFLPLPEALRSGGFGFGAREAIMIMGYWMGIGGNNMILYIAAISNIPEALYEAAEIDGAGSKDKFLHVTVPSVVPTTFFITVMAVIRGLQGGFQFAKIMTEGGPAGTTTTLAYYIYYSGFEQGQLGYASAVAWILFVIVFGATLVNWKYGNRRMEMV